MTMMPRKDFPRSELPHPTPPGLSPFQPAHLLLLIAQLVVRKAMPVKCGAINWSRYASPSAPLPSPLLFLLTVRGLSSIGSGADGWGVILQ